ncbi:MAG: WbqC family protein [Paludibacter sp.]
MKRVAILQSNYIPWKGYFDLMAAVDEFIIYDDVQYTRNDWRNRNQIKTPQGLSWLTVPVLLSGRFQQSIREAQIAGDHWARDHWRSLQLNYQRATYFAHYAGELEQLLRGTTYQDLSSLNHALMRWVACELRIATRLVDSRNYELQGDRNERLVNLCRQAGATVYVSGPAAQAYLDVAAFNAAGITVEWFGYQGFPPYPQLWGEFVHAVSVLDLLFNCGPQSPHYLRHHPEAHHA